MSVAMLRLQMLFAEEGGGAVDLEARKPREYDLAPVPIPTQLRMSSPPCTLCGTLERRVCSMPTAKEFILTMDDRPGTLGKICRALADRNVNIVAAQSFPSSGKSLTRLVFDDPTKARSVLDNERVTY